MKRDGFTITMVFLAESANYGEGIGNVSSLKKMTRGNDWQMCIRDRCQPVLSSGSGIALCTGINWRNYWN